jgi:hypothetical protein
MMKIKSATWVTIKYEDNLFDVRFSYTTYEIEEIRSVDSEINIAYLLSSEVKREIQNIITNRGTHHAI